MTDNKLTDEEIIKRLEQCVKRGNRNYDTDIVLDLINRQKSEIESLKKTEIEIDDFCRRLCRMRMLNGSAIASYQDLQNYIQQEKAEAYKEFASRLKDAFPECNRDCKCPAIYFDDYCYIIDECCEEMVGEEE